MQHHVSPKWSLLPFFFKRTGLLVPWCFSPKSLSHSSNSFLWIFPFCVCHQLSMHRIKRVANLSLHYNQRRLEEPTKWRLHRLLKVIDHSIFAKVSHQWILNWQLYTLWSGTIFCQSCFGAFFNFLAETSHFSVLVFTSI